MRVIAAVSVAGLAIGHLLGPQNGAGKDRPRRRVRGPPSRFGHRDRGDELHVAASVGGAAAVRSHVHRHRDGLPRLARPKREATARNATILTGALLVARERLDDSRSDDVEIAFAIVAGRTVVRLALRSSATMTSPTPVPWNVRARPLEPEWLTCSAMSEHERPTCARYDKNARLSVRYRLVHLRAFSGELDRSTGCGHPSAGLFAARHCTEVDDAGRAPFQQQNLVLAALRLHIRRAKRRQRHPSRCSARRRRPARRPLCDVGRHQVPPALVLQACGRLQRGPRAGGADLRRPRRVCDHPVVGRCGHLDRQTEGAVRLRNGGRRRQPAAA